MNKETRTFIWGLILLISFTLASAGYAIKMIDGHLEWWRFVGLAVCFGNAYYGLYKVNKVTD